MAETKFVDPDLVKLVEQRIVKSIQCKATFDSSVMPIPQFYVIHGQTESNVGDRLTELLGENQINHARYRRNAKPELDDLEDVDVLVFENVEYVFSHIAELKNDRQIVIVINNTIPQGKAQKFWQGHFDYQLTYGLPPTEYFEQLFKDLFVQYGKRDDVIISLTNDDYEYLAKCAESCTETDAREFCKYVFWDAFFNDEKEISVAWLKERGLLMEDISAKTDVITTRKPRAVQDSYEIKDVEPLNKKLKLF